MKRHFSPRTLVTASSAAFVFAAIGLTGVAGCGGSGDTVTTTLQGLPDGKATLDQVTRGRYLVAGAGCSDCHAQGKSDPTSATWLAGYIGPADGSGPGAFALGPFHVYAANITPDVTTGIGGNSDRQIFNALRYGLDPGATPDVVITSTTPGTGNFPATPHFLPPIMPWASIRHFSDSDLWAIVAYLKHGVKPASNQVIESEAPPDFWASSSTGNAVGPNPFPSFPTNSEQFNP